MRYTDTVEVSLKGNKSYVGYCVASTIEHGDSSSIGIIPLASGYRRAKDQDLRFTTNYQEVMEDLMGVAYDEDLFDEMMSIPRSEIRWIRPYGLHEDDQLGEPYPGAQRPEA